MRLLPCSDLHREYGDFEFGPHDADVVMLAGDIDMVGTRGVEWAKATFNCPVLFSLGNHEWNDKDGRLDIVERMKAIAFGSNVTILDNEAVIIDGVRFIGSTLWCDYNLFGPEIQKEFLDSEDAKQVDNKNIGAREVHRRHLEAVKFLEAETSRPYLGHTVVMTHHAPSFRSLAPKQIDFRAAHFASHLDILVEKSGARLWHHGHLHNRVRYMIGKTEVVNNARGRPYKGEHVGFSPLIIEI